MPDDDWALAQGTVEFRNEERMSSRDWQDWQNDQDATREWEERLPAAEADEDEDEFEPDWTEVGLSRPDGDD